MTKRMMGDPASQPGWPYDNRGCDEIKYKGIADHSDLKVGETFTTNLGKWYRVTWRVTKRYGYGRYMVVMEEMEEVDGSWQ